VCINTIIASILFNTTPEEVRFIMIDPKRVELSIYNHIPSLLHPVIMEPQDAHAVLVWAVKEMERRYQMLSAVGIKNIEGYNDWVRQQNAQIDIPGEEDEEQSADLDDLEDVTFEKLPYIVVIIDELADLMMTDKSTKVEESICRLAQMARAIGIHLVVATQRPSVNVITGLIKANLPSRIAFAVSSQTDSRTILDMKGAEKLIGKGDMLYNPVGIPKPMRLQGALVTDVEINRVADFLRTQGPPEYVRGIAEVIESVGKEESGDVDEELDQAIIEDAMRLIVENRMGSTSMLQRLLKIGHNRAMKVMGTLEQIGVVGPFEDKKPRRVNWNTIDLEKYLSRSRRAAE
jgi:DNA segregation ATPase FtsK/SpoIIIE, S-DNA-T family